MSKKQDFYAPAREEKKDREQRKLEGLLAMIKRNEEWSQKKKDRQKKKRGDEEPHKASDSMSESSSRDVSSVWKKGWMERLIESEKE